MEEREMIEHIVKIDEYISANLKMPKVLTAIELKSLMSKANKLFNLADVPIVDNGSKPTGTGYRKWTEEEHRGFIEDYNEGMSKEDLAVKYQMKKKYVAHKYSYIKTKYPELFNGESGSKRPKKNKQYGKTWTDEQTQELINDVKAGILSKKELAKKYGKTRKKVQDKIGYMKKIGQLK